ncbi:MFS transporter [Pseudarthrobacter sulfonivorans]|uniref:MFS transporter n=1 Tax=Pseudarthrobacter sulfonivorans TaxID=121292 RepID=UPI0021067E8C|nr:MFS transporter [Pseudarthrobacter sulfonivorans]
MSDRTGGRKDPQTALPAAAATAFRVSPVIIWLGIVSMMTDISSESVAAILPLYVTGFLGLSTIAFGIIDGINQGASAVVRIAAGWVSDRSGQPKLVAAAGYGLSAVARVGFLFAGGFWTLAGIVTGDRIGKGIRTAPRDALISAAAQPEYLARSFGVHRMLDSIGAAAGPLLAFVILVLIPNGFSTVFIVSLAFAVVGVTVLVLMVPGRVREATSEPGGTRRPRFRWSRLRWVTLKQRALPRLLVTAGLLGVLTIGDGFIYLLLQNRGSFDVQWFPLLYVGTNVVFLLFAIPLGKLADRWGRIPVFLGGHLALLACYILAALPFGGLGSTLGCLVLLGLFYAATDGVLAAIVTQLSPPATVATALGAAQTVVALSRMAAAAAFGVLWFVLGPVTAMTLVAGLLAAGIVAGMVLMGGPRRTLAA